MSEININLIQAGIVISLFILSAWPLHKAIKIVKGKSKFHKTILVIMISGLVIGVINLIFSAWASLIAFICLLWIYKRFFKLTYFKAFIVWALHLAFIITGAIIMNFVLNSVAKVSLLFG